MNFQSIRSQFSPLADMFGFSNWFSRREECFKIEQRDNFSLIRTLCNCAPLPSWHTKKHLLWRLEWIEGPPYIQTYSTFLENTPSSAILVASKSTKLNIIRAPFFHQAPMGVWSNSWTFNCWMLNKPPSMSRWLFLPFDVHPQTNSSSYHSIKISGHAQQKKSCSAGGLECFSLKYLSYVNTRCLPAFINWIHWTLPKIFPKTWLTKPCLIWSTH